MKRKAATTYREAQTLVTGKQWSGAANRTYYALYQALVGEFEARGKTPADFARTDPRYPDKWPHWLVVQHCRSIGLDRKEAEVVAQAEALRVKADYQPGPVESWAVEAVLEKLPGLLDGLGVTCGK